MILARVAVRMMQPAVDEVVDVIPMRHSRMTTPGAMHVTGVVTLVAACLYPDSRR